MNRRIVRLMTKERPPQPASVPRPISTGECLKLRSLHAIREEALAPLRARVWMHERAALEAQERARQARAELAKLEAQFESQPMTFQP